MNIGILTSGNLGYEILKEILSKLNILFVLTDSNSKNIFELCYKNQIPCFQGNPRKSRGFDFIKNIEVDIIISINYLFLIELDIIQHAKKVSFNIHGSLLPKYRGRTPHVWSIINNEKTTGVTAHLIDEGCDTGAILGQIEIPIEKTDSGYNLLQKYRPIYLKLLYDIIEKIKMGDLTMKPQNSHEATYFGKRSPEDGQINWNWQKERIINWVRAQSFPYPGAYSYVRNEKIIIDEIKESNQGFNYDFKNGLVVNVDSTIKVKTPNGVLEITKIRNDFTFRKGDLFYENEK